MCVCVCERERERERETGRQTDRQTDRRTHGRTDGRTERQRDRETERKRQRCRDRDAETEIEVLVSLSILLIVSHMKGACRTEKLKSWEEQRHSGSNKEDMHGHSFAANMIYLKNRMDFASLLISRLSLKLDSSQIIKNRA